MAGILSPELSSALTFQNSKLLSPDTTITGNKLFSDISTKIASENQVSTNIGQAGLFNLSGNLDLSTKKSALLYSPISVVSSPNAKVSSSPQIEQGGGDNPLSGLFSGGNTLLLVAGLGIALFFLTGRKSEPKTSSVTFAPSARVRTGNIKEGF